MHSRFRKSLVCAVVLCAALGYWARAEAQTVVARKRLGNNTEGISFFPRGKRDNVAITDGYDVFSVRLSSESLARRGTCKPTPTRARRPCRHLFSTRSLGTIPPRGIVYVPSQDKFYFSAVDPTKLYVTDTKGTVLQPLPITHLSDSSTISQWEGLAYIPSDSPMFPDTIAGITVHGGVASHVLIIGLDGVVLHEIVFPEGSPLSTLGAIAYKPPDRLLLSSASLNGVIYETSLTGNEPIHVATIDDASVLEGLTTTDDGRVVAADYSSGRLYLLDTEFHRRPSDDRMYVVGFGIRAGKLAWNPDTNEFLVSNFAVRGNEGTVFAVSSNLRRFERVVDLADTQFKDAFVFGLGYLPGESLVAITTAGPGIRAVALFDATTGAFVSQIDTPFPFPVTTDVTPLGEDLALRVRGAPEIRAIDRTGMERRRIPLSPPPTDGGLAIHKGLTGDEIVVGLFFYDLNGTLLRTIDKAALDVSFVIAIAPITSGRYRGTFAIVEAGTSELIIFTEQ